MKILFKKFTVTPNRSTVEKKTETITLKTSAEETLLLCAVWMYACICSIVCRACS